MPDLVIGSHHRPYSLVTTAVRRAGVYSRSAQLDLYVTTGNVRLRFADTVCLRIFADALEQLHFDMTGATPFMDREIQTRVYSDKTDPHDI